MITVKMMSMMNLAGALMIMMKMMSMMKMISMMTLAGALMIIVMIMSMMNLAGALAANAGAVMDEPSCPLVQVLPLTLSLPSSLSETS